MSEYRTVDVKELRERLERGPVAQFWNVLSDDFFTGELIPGSRRVPVGRVGHEARSLGLDSNSEIFVYCSGPNCPQSEAAARKLAGLGFRNVHAFEGGLSAWKEAGLPLEADGVTSAMD